MFLDEIVTVNFTILSLGMHIYIYTYTPSYLNKNSAKQLLIFKRSMIN